MSTMTFHAPATVAEACALLAAEPGARVLAGGTDLIVQMRSGRIAPAAVIDLKRIGALSGVREQAGGFVIGAATRCTALKEHAALAAAHPGVVEAANLIGSVQVRNRATVAGNLCNASPAADSVPAMIAAGAVALIAGPQGARELPVEHLPQSPGRTALAPGEFVTAIRLPGKAAHSSDAYQRLTPRTEMDIAIVGVGAAITLAGDGSCAAARIALGAVGPVAVLAEAAGAALVGTRFEAAALDRMAEAVQAVCKPIDDKRGSAAYRTAMAAVLARRVVQIARERAGEA
ncbi:MAG: xanthine dehydrogenase family protein subunit M [Sphingomonadales bacterium]|nr:xanthine dehydrogenase family protein subunit M [Sphingomonadales bacterium]